MTSNLRGTVFSLLLAVASACYLPAQTIVSRLDISKRDAFPESIHYCAADGGFVTFGRMSAKSSRFYGINKYNGNFEKEWTKQVLESTGKNRVDFISVIGEKIFVFITDLNTRDDKVRTSFRTFDLAGNALVEQEVFSTVDNDPQSRGDFRYALSLNKKVLVVYRNLNNKMDHEQTEYYLFDEERGKFAGGRIEMPYSDEKFQVRNVVVSNDGSIFILGKNYLVNTVNSPDDYDFILFRFDTETSTLDDYKVGFGNNFITDLNMKVDKHGTVYLAGFYSERSSSQIIGTLYQRLDEDLKPEISEARKFSDSFLDDFLSDRQIENGKELKNFYLDDIILRSDGGLLLIAERFYITYNSFLDLYGYWVDQKIYHYDEIIVNSLGADGSLEWSAVVFKRQSSDNNEHLSYVDVVSGADLYLIYQYQPKRETETLYYNAVSMDGKVEERAPFLGIMPDNTLLFPRLCEQISNSEGLMVYYSERDRHYTIAKVEF